MLERVFKIEKRIVEKLLKITSRDSYKAPIADLKNIEGRRGFLWKCGSALSVLTGIAIIGQPIKALAQSCDQWERQYWCQYLPQLPSSCDEETGACFEYYDDIMCDCIDVYQDEVVIGRYEHWLTVCNWVYGCFGCPYTVYGDEACP